MLKFLFLLSFVATVYSLSSEEIDDITTKIDNELRRLRGDASKKSINNDQVATAQKDDAKFTRLLASYVEKELKKQGFNHNSEYELTLNRLLHHFKKRKKSKNVKKETSEDEKKTSDDDELFKLLVEADKKKKGAEKKETNSQQKQDEALLRIIIDDEIKKKNAEKKELSQEQQDEALLRRLIKEERSKHDEAQKKEVHKSADAHVLRKVLENEEQNRVSKKETIEKKDHGKVEFEYKEYCEDQASADTCKFYHNGGYCIESYKEQIIGKCEKTCGFCKECKDDPNVNCKNAVNYCDNNLKIDSMKKHCPKTCGYCGRKAPAPPACQNHPDGCCWDGISFAKDGCPPCENQYGKICDLFQTDCTKKDRFGFLREQALWMRHYCPDSCGVCEQKEKISATCEDDSKYADNACKEDKVCTEMKFREIYCRKTCGSC